MRNNLKEVNTKSSTQYFFDSMININNFDLNIIELDQRSYKNILIYYIGFVRVEDFSYAATKSVNPLKLIINEINGYVERKQGK